MNSKRHASAAVFLLGLVLQNAPATAQSCRALPSLQRHWMVLSGQASSYTYASAWGLSATVGKTWFGSLTLGTTRDHEMRVGTTDLAADVGRETVVGSGRRIYFCPTAGASASLGPTYQLISPGDTYRRRAANIGLDGAVVALRRGRFEMITSGSYRLIRLSTELRHLGSKVAAPSNTYSSLAIILGLSYDGRIAIAASAATVLGLTRPDIGRDFAVPFGREEAETSLAIRVAFAFPRRTTN